MDEPFAISEIQALADVFDTNHNGKLDAGDANFAAFKLMVANADGTTTLQTLAQAGIASIKLTSDAAKTVLPDGSSIDGQTTFTRTNGPTGAAAAVSFAYDPNGYVVKPTMPHDADGSTAINSNALNPDGSLANGTISTTSADSKTMTLTCDWNSDAVVDQGSAGFWRKVRRQPG